MDIKTILLTILAGVLANNYAMTKFLGVDSVMGKCTCVCKSLWLGASVTVVMLLSTLITAVVPVPAALQLFFFVLVVLAVSAIVEKIACVLRKKPLDNGFILLGLNAAVLGGVILNSGAKLGESLLAAFAAGLGLTVAMLLYGSIRERVEDDYAPKALRGLPLSLLTAGFICLALGCLSF